MIKDKITQNKIIQNLYHTKAYFDIGVQQISWFTGKLPEIMGGLYLLEKFGVVVLPNYLVIVTLIIFMCIVVLGYVLKITGLYDSDRKASYSKDPVMSEVYQASKIIIARFGTDKDKLLTKPVNIYGDKE